MESLGILVLGEYFSKDLLTSSNHLGAYGFQTKQKKREENTITPISYYAVCRTAPATPVLSTNILITSFRKFYHKLVKEPFFLRGTLGMPL